MTRLFKLAAGMGLPSSRYARLGQAHTGDLQKRRYTNNAIRLQAAIIAFGFQATSVSLDAIEKPNAVLSIGVEPVRIDLLNGIAGVSFDEARPNIVAGRYGDVSVSFIGKEDLLRNKRSTGRQRDLGDVEELT